MPASKPRVLILDIETAPGIAYIWNMYDDFVPLERLIRPGRVLCWGAKWFGKKELYFADERTGAGLMLKQLYDLLAEADAVVTYNGDRFDLPKIRGALVEAHMDPLPNLTSIDVLKTVKKLGLQSAKLAFISKHLGIGQKVDTGGFSLWRQIVETGDPAAWAKMRRYNLQDVRLLDKLYRYLRPHIRNHPYLGETGTHACGNCGSRRIQLRGTRRTKAFTITRLHCQTCGAWSDGARKRVNT